MRRSFSEQFHDSVKRLLSPTACGVGRVLWLIQVNSVNHRYAKRAKGTEVSSQETAAMRTL